MRAIALSLVLIGSAAYAKKAAEGMPEIKPTDEAIFVWHDAQGWHLRASAAKKQHAFQGVLRADGGDIAKIKPTRPMLLSKIDSSHKGALHFEFDLVGGFDGFDWDTAAPCMIVELRMDKKPQPD